MWISSRLFVICLLLHLDATCSEPFETHLRGPGFVMEPPGRVEFSNSSGGWLDCSASGSPQPTIDWVHADGTAVTEIHGVRRVLRNGTLVLMPFAAAAYHQDIHNTIYRCIASNSVGRIVSRDVQVRAVVAQAYKVDVEVLSASRGCTAILRCVVPTFVKELVRVVSWVHEPAIYIYPSLQGDGKFHLLPTGELLIHNLQESDESQSFRCRSMHRLTRQVVVSSPTRLRINSHRGIISPSVVEHTAHVQVSQDEGAVLLCVAQGCPSPEYSWYTHNGAGPLPVLSGPRVRLLGPILAIEAVTGEDSGVYKCTASNVGGEASAELRLTVATPIQVEISPNVLSVHMGGTAEFRCLVTSNGSPVGMQNILWYKDGRQLPSSGRVEDTLMVSRVSRENRGMYQCVVRRPEGDTFQATAELQLGDAPPVLLYSFIEQTLQPGPAVSLKCSAAGNPTPQISWTLDGFPLPSNGRFMIGQYITVHGDVISHVNISHVMVEDGGEYACIAENRAGRVQHAARLNIYGLPYIRLIPKVTAVSGETLNLKCPVAGYPIEEIHWERGGRELPDDIRQRVQPDGSLTISPVQKNSDSGVYTCWARNKQGHSARRSGEVTVIVPPSIEPFAFQEGLAEGMRTRTVCGVSRGDAPLKLIWLKDGEPLPDLLGANVTMLDQYSSLLSIPSLSATHSGEYTCVAKNPAAEIKYTALLQVKVPPRWIVEPADANVERNRHIMLHCQAQGVPTPSIVWKKATGSKSGEYEEVRERPFTKLLANGSLLLQHVKEDREGFYLCQANNGIGTGIGKVIQLKVNSSPYFSSTSRSVTVKKGDTALLQCAVSGDKPINIVWMRSGKNTLNPSTNYKISVKQEATPDGVSAELQIRTVDATDSGPYFCRASNLYGNDQQLVQLQVQEPPQPPSVLEAAMISSRSVNLKWQPKSLGTGDVSKYLVEYREADPLFVEQWQQLEVKDPPSFNALIENLKPATKYAFRVIAEGNAGRSAPSQELIVRTEPQRPAGPPLNLSARPLSSTELLISWVAPLPELRHGDIQGYNVGYKLASSGNTAYNFTSVSGDGDGGSGELLLSGLAKFARYNVVVQAFNQVGPGPLSEPSAAQTMEDVPSRPPEDVRCAALSSQSLQVSWQPPPIYHTNGLLQGYKLVFEPIMDDILPSKDEVESRKTTALTMVLTGLRKYTNYSIQVLAHTRMGDGSVSKALFCHSEEDVPEAPADIKVVVSSTQSLYISWLPPTEPNGVITKYSLYTRVVNGREELNNEKRSLPSQQHFYESKGLHPHMEYQFWVTASTRVGEGKSSRVVSQITTNRVPARIISFGGPAVRPWRATVTLPCTAVGKPKREWFKSDVALRQGGLHNSQLLDSGDLIINNLQLADGGNYSCQVDNGIGTDRLTHTLVVQVPPSAPVLYVTSATSSSILMHWKCGFTGNAPITGYTLFYRRGSGNTDEMQLSRHASSHELKGLVCGSTYQIHLSAQNKVGTSPTSIMLHVRTQGQAPGMPASTSLLAPNSTSVLIRLHTWPDNGCPLMYFVLQYRAMTDDPETEWVLVSNALKPQRRVVVPNLQPSTLYQMRMEAHNVAGASQAEFSFVTLTKDGDPPPPEIVQRGQRGPTVFYGNINLLIPSIAALSGMICTIAMVIICYRHILPPAPSPAEQSNQIQKESLENRANSEAAQRERYYATIHKVSMQNNDKIPETSEDISPYATFQLSEAGNMSQPHHSGPANTLLHSFMYHERALAEGCSSPPPAAVLKPTTHHHHHHNQRPPKTIHNYYQTSPFHNISKNRRRHSRKTEPESEESESDQDQLTSSRTESSNQHEGKIKHSIIYHGAQSSTSSDLSPMSEQKSLPRRGRSRYHHQQYQFSTNTTPRHHNSNKMNNNTTNTTATNTATSSGNSSKILSPRGVGGVGGVGGNLKSISSTFKSQDSIQCHIPTLVKSPSISTQQQKQFHKQQINSQNHNQNHNPNQTSSSLKQQQPLLITPKLHQLESVPSSSMHVNGQELVGLDGVVGSPLASVVPVTCMPPSSQFRPIPHKSIMPAHEPPHHHHHQGVAASSGTLLNPSTALLSSKFFTAPTLPK
ncbi:Down syndrome cell adhesion molecule-like protein Dscam2 isoform X4 [Drosophila miranda]|uniref:Down syndrome cell adhesion molecule-like protein Dscam2 isoform X4 n=1 Tax=Drosophila pseudoobscura pseudoobscura TaxID=46245 RepID=A0A6I8W4W1_DROPS|nr:Down syndrome cell adhesion molecule-like protein Dscam2 isoform X4 [Drosophila miranda]XP_033238322.1 Down syndrome cell adhesion molecule-like protein Dscam2 isoform X4 [Drosophila pseudoobscura]